MLHRRGGNMSVCTLCGKRPSVMLLPGGDRACDPCVRDLLEQERDEDGPRGEWDAAGDAEVRASLDALGR